MKIVNFKYLFLIFWLLNSCTIQKPILNSKEYVSIINQIKSHEISEIEVIKTYRKYEWTPGQQLAFVRFTKQSVYPNAHDEILSDFEEYFYNAYSLGNPDEMFLKELPMIEPEGINYLFYSAVFERRGCEYLWHRYQEYMPSFGYEILWLIIDNCRATLKTENIIEMIENSKYIDFEGYDMKSYLRSK